MIKKGIFFSPGVSFISYSHTSEDIELTLNALEDVCKEIKKNVIDIQTPQELDEYPATWIMINMDLYDELGSILDNENIQWKW